MLKYILLGFLSYQSQTGYQLKTLMEQSTMHFWHAYHSQIYTTLRALEGEGLVISEVEEGDEKLNRRSYEITEAGLEVLRQWLTQPLMAMTPEKNELLVRVFFSGQRTNEAISEELRIQRRLHQQQLDMYRTLDISHFVETLSAGTSASDQEIRREGFFWKATLEYGIAHEEMHLRWLDQMLTAVEPS
jgi:PadR family transcriptional regulator AphA